MESITLKEEQDIQLKILERLNYVCKEENIKFYLAYGTLLGAIRNNGFIPWDDDIDVWMERDDIAKFKKVFYRYFDRETYFFQDSMTDETFVSSGMSRICVNNTLKWPLKYGREKFHKGIFFDIFPLDYAFNDKLDFSNIKKFTRLHQKSYNTLKRDDVKGLKRKILYFCRHIIPRKVWNRKIQKIIKIHSGLKQSEKRLVFSASYAGLNRCYFDSSYFEQIEFHLFEGILLPCPINSIKLLEYMYGEDFLIPIKTKPDSEKAYKIK